MIKPPYLIIHSCAGLETLARWLRARLFITNYRPVKLVEKVVFSGFVYLKVGRAGFWSVVLVNAASSSCSIMPGQACERGLAMLVPSHYFSTGNSS